MPPRVSAGLVMYRVKNGILQVFLAHPGGPLFRNKDDGHWTIPKGEPPHGEALFDAAIREFEEETGVTPRGPFTELGSIRQRGGKTVYAWAFEGEQEDPGPVRSNSFEIEWPPGSGRIQSYPEIDRAGFCPLDEAKRKLKEAQWPLIERLAALVAVAADRTGRLR